MAERHVQAVLPDPLYESLWKEARRQKRPVKAVVREAIERYLQEAVPPGEDPLSSFVGRGNLKGRDWSERKDWRA